jgi:hypothetical protein
VSSIAINSPKGISAVVGSVYKLSIKESKKLSIITTCSGVTDLSKSSTSNITPIADAIIPFLVVFAR